MAEEKSDQFSPEPLTERDLNPIKPLAAEKILNFASQYTRALFRQEQLTKILANEAREGVVDAEIPEEMHYQAGICDALGGVLEELGQSQLISTINTKVRNMLDHS